MSIQPPPVCNPDGVAWFLRHRDGVVHGPFPFGSLIEAGRIGRIASDTMVSHPDFTNSRWVLALEIPEIATAARISGRLPSTLPADAATEKRSLLSRCRLDHPGKRLLLAMTLIWLGGLPLAFAWGVIRAHHGGEYHADAELYEFHSFVVGKAEMPLRERHFAGRSIALWSGLYAVAALASVVVLFTVPDRPWRPDITG